MLRLLRVATSMRDHEAPVEFVATFEPPRLTPRAARLLAELVKRATKLDATEDRGSSAA
jgi:hypothetical protein